MYYSLLKRMIFLLFDYVVLIITLDGCTSGFVVLHMMMGCEPKCAPSMTYLLAQLHKYSTDLIDV